jgi:nicotinic acetylcholine receptor
MFGDSSPESDAKRLYDDKLKKNDYSKLIRPVGNTSDSLTVRVGLRLTSIIDVDEKNQIMTTNVWLEQIWYDFRLTWNPEEYGGVERLYVPPNEIWLPDIVLYNSADGNFTVKLLTKATIHSDGQVVWKPPAIYKSLCPINVEFFPFDEQLCTLKIGSWTYDGYSVNIQHKDLAPNADHLDIIEQGINLDDYYKSTEWDLLGVRAQKAEKFYPCCSEPYPDIKFNITIRRKTLFYTVNLIMPCIAICSVTLLVFYMPANSGEKITMGITILNSLNIFLLLVAEINPPTSLATPLIGKFLLFTMVIVTCSIMMTVLVLNIHFRSPSTHVMAPWVQDMFLRVLPRLLFMQRPQDRPQLGSRYSKASVRSRDGDSGRNPAVRSLDILSGAAEHGGPSSDNEMTMSSVRRHSVLPTNVMQAVIGVKFIADHMKQQDEDNRVKQDWQFVAMVLDRLLFWLFTAVCTVGTFGIIIQAPTLYDPREPIFTKN